MQEPTFSREPTPAPLLTGKEVFRGTQLGVLDLWRWALSDLRERHEGVLAGFLVGEAIGDPTAVRGSWGNYDVETPAAPASRSSHPPTAERVREHGPWAQRSSKCTPRAGRLARAPGRRRNRVREGAGADPRSLMSRIRARSPGSAVLCPA
jgi:hypothetical protein